MTRGTKVTNKKEYNHMKLTYIRGSAVPLRNVWRRDILKKIRARWVQRLVEIQGVEPILVIDKLFGGLRVEAGLKYQNHSQLRYLRVDQRGSGQDMD